MRYFTDPELNIMIFDDESKITASGPKTSELDDAVGKDNKYAETEDYNSINFGSMGS